MKIIIPLLFMFLVSGCFSSLTEDTTTTPPQTMQQALIREIHKTSWLITIFIVAGVLGIVSFIRGNAFGLTITAACIGGWIWVRIDQSLVSNQWILLGAGALVIIGFGLFMYRDYVGKKAFGEVVKTVDLSRRHLTEQDDKELFTSPLGIVKEFVQSPSTTKLVKETKKCLQNKKPKNGIKV